MQRSSTPILLVLFLCLGVVHTETVWGQERDVDVLVRQLADPTQAEEATRRLLDLGPKVLKDLQEFLDSGRTSETVKREILKILPSLGKKGVALLMDAVDDPALELEAMKQLGMVTGDRKVQALFFSRARKSANPRVRSQALDWLALNASGKNLESLLLELLGDPSPEVRDKAASLVGTLLGIQIVPQLMNELRDAEFKRSVANRGVRLSILDAMGHLGAQDPRNAARVVPTLIQALGVDDERPTAVKALIRIGPQSVPSLLMILKAGDTTRAGAAMEALLSIGREAAPEVVSLLQARHPKMRSLAAQFLSFYQDDQVFPLLKQLYGRAKPREKLVILRIASLYGSVEAFELIVSAVNDEEPAVRLQAVKMLSSSDQKGAVPVLLGRVEEDPDLDIRIEAVRGLHRLGDSSAVDSLVRSLGHEKWQVCVAILDTLAHLGTSKAVKTVAEQLRHRKTEVASSAERALNNITFLSGQRSPENWQSEIEALVASQKGDLSVDVNMRTIRAGSEVIEVAVLGSGSQTVLTLASCLEINAGLIPRYAYLMAQDYTVVLVPFSGCDAAQGSTDAFKCMERMAERLHLVKSETTKEPAVLVGHAIPGMALLSFAQKYPKDVDRIIWANPVFPRRRVVDHLKDATFKGLTARWKAELELLRSEAGKFLPRALNAYMSRVELSSQVSGEGKAMVVSKCHYGVTWFLNETRFEYRDTRLQTALANLPCPMLLVFGKDDWTLDEQVERFRPIGKMRRNLVTTMVDGSVRYTPIERPEVFAASVKRFVENYRFKKTASGVGGAISLGQAYYGDYAGMAMGTGADSESAPAQRASSNTGGQVVESSRLTRFLTTVNSDGTATTPRTAEAPVATVNPVVVTPEPPVVENPVTVAKVEKKAEPPVEPTKEEPAVEAVVVATPELAPEETTAVVVATRDTTEFPPDPPDHELSISDTVESPVTTASRPVPSFDNSISQGSSNDRVKHWLPWTLIGSGLAIAGAGVYLNMMAIDKANQADGMDPMLPNYSNNFDTTFGQAQNLAIGAYVAYGVGAACALLGLDFLIGWPIPFGTDNSRTVARSWRLTPVVLEQGGALVLDMNLP